MPNLDLDRYADGHFTFFNRSLYDDFLAERSDEWGIDNVNICLYIGRRGHMFWTNRDDKGESCVVGIEGCGSGGTFGMLLNLVRGTLAVYKNNRRLGVMKDGLSGSYCWCASTAERDSITIKRGEAPRA
ncbi:hypothetical protein THAOC_21157 [Thalassiosira oceanica]|uniref:Uncharacterized protein n=1 Tax=Thalassiosira oceanica TaxID=159749 RepID=K0RY85_THAOC|nr:hypothetical protein THAOC_21157 [Thalassiosira oceanica]|eukprot:EJK58693.1 hypothetical protein THAOC_21157 [Thalassiosira oceanica]